MKDYPQRKLDCSNNELELFTRTTFARAKVFSSKEMEKEFFLSNWPSCCDQSTYFYNNMILRKQCKKDNFLDPFLI